MRFSMLGPLEVTERGHRVDLGRDKAKAVLALLVFHANRVVTVERLADELWDGEPPDQAASALRLYISRLRKALGDESGTLIVTEPAGYVLRISADDLDVTHAERLAADGHRDLDAERFDSAAVRLRDALVLWRGRAYDDIADLTAGRGESARLEELRLATIEARVEADLGCGRHAELAGELEALVLDHPLRERLWRARMLALYRAGRQADALRAYQELRDVLAEELGLDPSPGLSDLERAILTHDAGVLLPAAAPTPPAQAPRPDPTPSDPTAAAPPSRIGETGVVTLLFTDLAGSTELADGMDDADFDELRRRHFRLLRDATTAHGGEEVKSLGDGIMAVFGSPKEAVAAAVEMQSAVARANRRDSAHALGLRIGIHTGEPSREDGDYFGTPVVVAKRLCDRAEAGQVLASAVVRELLGSGAGFELQSLGLLELKGIAEPVGAWEVTWDERSAISLPAALQAPGGVLGFVGRSDELTHLSEAWEATQAGSRRVVLLAGEPGIGKTTLAARLAEITHRQGAIVLFGHCDEAAVVPFQPFVEAFETYLRQCDAPTVGRLVGERAPDLALLLPRLRDMVLGLPEVGGGGAETERYRMFEAVPEFLAAVAEDAPIVLVLDDLHWADRPTLQLLHHTIKRCTGVALLIVGTYRDTDLVRTHPMAEVLVDLRRAELVERLPLRGLAIEDVAAIVTGDPAQVDDPFAVALWSETEGSPLFVREILRHLEETGAAAHTDDGRWVARRRVEQLGIPEGVKEVIGRRLTRLSDAANAILTAGSVQGRTFRVALIERLVDQPLDTILDALDDSTAAGVVCEVPGEAGAYEFTHALVREALYDELSLTRRVRLHQRVGEAIEVVHAANLDPHLGELAHHFGAAAVGGSAGKAIEYGWRAGKRARDQLAYEQASSHFSATLEVAVDAEAPLEVQADLLLARGDAEWRTRDYRIARRTFEQAAELARRSGDTDRLARAALGNAGGEARPYWVEIGRVNHAVVALLEEALEVLPRHDSDLRSRLLSALAIETYFAPGGKQRCDQLSADGLAMARRLGDPATIVNSLTSRNLAIVDAANSAERLANVEEAMLLAETDQARAAIYLHLWVSLMELGELPRSDAALEQIVEITDRLRDPILQSTAKFSVAGQAVLRGNLGEAERLAREAFALANEYHDPNGFGLFGLTIAVTFRAAGRSAELIAPFTATAGLYPLIAEIPAAGEGLARLEAGDLAGAQALLDRHPPEAIAFNGSWLLIVGVFGLIAADLGDVPMCERYYEALLPHRTKVCTGAAITGAGSQRLVLGALAATLGRHDDAIHHLEIGLDLHQRWKWRVPETETLLRLAGVLVQRNAAGDAERAQQLAEVGLTLALEIGMPTFAARFEALLEGLAGRPAAAGPTFARPNRRQRVKARATTAGRKALGRATRRRSDDELVDRFAAPAAQRALFTALAASFQPAASLGFQGDIGFEIHLPTDDPDPLPPDWWTIEVGSRRATAERRRAIDPAATFVVELPDFVRIASGEMHPVEAIIEGVVKVRGDVLLAARLGDMFAIEDIPQPA